MAQFPNPWQRHFFVCGHRRHRLGGGWPVELSGAGERNDHDRCCRYRRGYQYGDSLVVHGRKEKRLNIKGAFLHMAAVAAVSAGVVVSGLLIVSTGWNNLDPIISIVIAFVILFASWGLLIAARHDKRPDLQSSQFLAHIV